MRIDREVTSVVDRTLAGRQLVVGRRDTNRCVKFGRGHDVTVQDFLARHGGRDIDPRALSDADTSVLRQFDRLGFLDTSEPAPGSFNEFRNVGHVFWEVHPRGRGGGLGDTLPGMVGHCMVVLALVAAAVLWRDHMPSAIAFTSMGWTDIIVSLTVFPVLFLGLHEVGHLMAARSMGVRVQSLVVGWMIINPIILVTYRGLNLESQRRRTVVILGGVTMNLALMVAGLAAKEYAGLTGPLVDLWIGANLGMILGNASFLGMTDGYFLVTMYLGYTNLRMRGYRALHAWLHRTRSVGTDTPCGVALVGLLVLSLVNLWFSALYFGGLFGLPTLFIHLGCAVLTVLTLGRLLGRVARMFNNE